MVTASAIELPGEFRQLGFIVRDLDEAIAGWLALGVGPFYVLRGLRQDATYRGKPCSVPFSVAFANNGALQIELIYQEDDTPSIYTEFLDSGREGMHQLAWWASDFDATIASIEAAGWPVVWHGGADGGARYAYVEPLSASPATIVEIMELTPASEGLATLVQTAAADWDGSDPIRALG